MRWTTCCKTIVFLILTAVACSPSEQHFCIMPADCQLHEGDIVFRRGGSMMSRSVVALDAHGQYSHVGIVVDSAGCPMVVHAVPGEPDYGGDVDRVKMDTPERFFSSENAVVGEVCRHADTLVARQAAREAWRVYRRNILFDHDYDAADTTRMYCTELVVHAYERAGCRLTEAPPRRISLPGLHVDCYFPSDVYDCSQLQSVRKFNR